MAGDGSEPGAQLEPLDDFVRRVTSTFDFSHDYNHAVEVTKLAQRIGEKELDAQTWASAQRIILYAGMLHDVVDHKYEHMTSLTKEGRDSYIRSSFAGEPEAGTMVIDIIDNISYSKERKGLRKDLGKRGNLLLDVVSDADRITALGEVGIQRSLAYAEMLEPHASKATLERHVLEHSFEKLLKLRAEYIRTATGKELAKEGHDQLKRWVQGMVAQRLDEFYG